MTKKIILVSSHIIGEKMSSLGLRHYEISRSLCRNGFTVDIISPFDSEPASKKLDENITVHYTGDTSGTAKFVNKNYNEYSAIIIDTYINIEPFLKEEVFSKPIVYDVNCILFLETLSMNGIPADSFIGPLNTLKNKLMIGDFFTYSNQRIKHFLLGCFSMLGRLNKCIYNSDSRLENILGYLPFGIPAEPAVKREERFRNKYSIINDETFVIIWQGGLLDWYEPMPLIKAVERLYEENQNIVLVLPGVPPTQEPHSMHKDIIKYCKDKNLEDKCVIILDEWYEYKNRADYLLSADAGAAAGADTIEGEMSSRTRIMDYIWAGLPSIIYGNDFISELVDKKNIGVCLKENSIDIWKKSIKEVRNKGRNYYHNNIEEVRKEFIWDKAVEPMINFLNNPVKLAEAYNINQSNKMKQKIIYYLKRSIKKIFRIG